MSRNAGIITFKDVSYEHQEGKPILVETSFSIRRGAKFTLMGKNGAGKSTLFGLITGQYSTVYGNVFIMPKISIAVSKQVIPKEELELTIRDFFQNLFEEKVYNIDSRIDEVLEIINLGTEKGTEVYETFKDRTVGSFSGGQQARLLLASALILKPEVLLLDEPTNNLDVEGIAYLTKFLKEYKKTVIVISHDAEFLNSFTQGVLYLNSQTRKIEKYDGNYNNVVGEIERQVAKETRKNAQLAKEIQANKDKANFFAHKGGRLRAVAKKMREKVEDYEDNKVEVRREDKTIRNFIIPVQRKLPLNILKLSSYTVFINHKSEEMKTNLTLQRGDHIHMVGPNGIGKTTLLEALASGIADGEKISDGVKIGYYRQDFSNLDFEKTPREILMQVMEKPDEQDMRSLAAGFLVDAEIINTKIGSLSEGQKALVAFARLTLMKPGLLILDEPTNHVNFRHIPIIAKALANYEGAMILVSHVPEFVDKIVIDNIFDLSKKVK